MLLLFVRVGLALESFRVLVLFFIPLVIVKVITHLPDCFCCRGLVLHRNLCQTCVHIEFNVVTIQNSLVVIVYLHVLETSNSLIVIACYCLVCTLLDLVKLFSHPVDSFGRVKNCLFFIFGWRFGGLRGRGRRFCSNFDVVRWEKSVLFWFFDEMS